MDAGKTLRVKLRYRSRLSPPHPTSNFRVQDAGDIKELAVASDSEHIDEPVMEPILDPLQTSFDNGNPSSIPPPTMMPLTSAAILSHRRRGKSSASLKRSASSPNVRADAGMTLAEKRRNKLGYHRTSVACGHCRRRKIRCLLAPDDTQNRCANCIRLKKDCSFFPVDQQPQIDRRPRASSTRIDTRTSNSSESSPAMAGGHMFDRGDDFNSYPHLTVPVAYPTHRGSIGGLSPMSGVSPLSGISPMTKAPIHSQTFEFPPQNRSSWGSPFTGDGPTSAGHSSPGDSTHTYWGRHSDSPLTPGYSPHMLGRTSTLHSASDGRSSFTSFAPSLAPSRSHSDSTWAMPTRSMSFGIVEDLPQSYQNHYNPQPVSMDYRRRASEMHPPSLQTSNNSSNGSTSEAHMAPLSAPVATPPLQHWVTPTTWSTLSSSLVTKAPDYGSWYGDAAPLAKVTEEDIGHFNGEPAILYPGEHQ